MCDFPERLLLHSSTQHLLTGLLRKVVELVQRERLRALSTDGSDCSCSGGIGLVAAECVQRAHA
jgi:hypothetical protein